MIGEGAADFHLGAAVQFPQVGDHVAALAGGVGGKTCVGHHTVFIGSQHRLVEILVRRHGDMAVGIVDGCTRFPGGAPQEGEDLRLGAGLIGRECGSAGAAGHALFNGPADRFVAVIAHGHVGINGLGGAAASSASVSIGVAGDRRKFCVIDEPRQYENLRLSQE